MMNLLNFIKTWLVLPIGVLLQFLGYTDTAHKFGLPEPFLFSTAGFLLAAASLIWFAWFSGRISRVKRGIVLGVLVTLSFAYYTFLQYEFLVYAERQAVATTLDFDSANALLSHDANAALAYAQRLVERMPDAPQVYNLRGRALDELGRHTEAYKDFTKAAQLDPAIDYYEYNRAVALRNECDYEGALRLLDGYVDKYKDDIWGIYDHGVVSQILGKYDRALRDYDIVIYSNNMDAPVGSALFNSAVIHALYAANANQPDVRDRELREAFSFLDRAIRRGRSARLQKIHDALVPISQREPECTGFYKTDDFTVVADLPQFKEWFKKYE
jgi:tetratricopeptide (TPR) repeat protein